MPLKPPPPNPPPPRDTDDESSFLFALGLTLLLCVWLVGVSLGTSVVVDAFDARKCRKVCGP